MSDVNNDGKIDIVAAEFWGNSVTIIESNDGRFDDHSKLNITSIESYANQDILII